MYAKRIGTNIDKLIVATNLNDILHRTITTGRYLKDKVYKTHSPSMDIQVSSNFERLLFHIYKNPNIVKKLIITTAITSILFAIIYFLNYFDILNVRRILS